MKEWDGGYTPRLYTPEERKRIQAALKEYQAIAEMVHDREGEEWQRKVNKKIIQSEKAWARQVLRTGRCDEQQRETARKILCPS